MKYTSEDWRYAVKKLINLTSLGEVKWYISDLNSEKSYIDRSMQCDFNDRVYVISIYDRKYIDNIIENRNLLIYGSKSNISINKFDKEEMFDFSVYEKIDNKYAKIASGPSLSIYDTLFRTAEDSLAFSKGALKGLLD